MNKRLSIDEINALLLTSVEEEMFISLEWQLQDSAEDLEEVKALLLFNEFCENK
jgi:hypothetical protein